MATTIHEVDENEEATTADAQQESFQEHFSKAFQVIYGGPAHQTPKQVPAVASLAATSYPTTDHAAAVPVLDAAPTDDYLQTLQETLVPTVPPAVNLTTAHEREKPRTLRIQNAKTKKWQKVQETPEQAQERCFRQERKTESINITGRWKERAHDLRGEEDVGGAMEERAKRHLREKVRREVRERQELEQERQKQEKKEKEQLRKQQQSQNNEDEDSVQEQQDVLDRLTQQSIDEGTGDGATSRSSVDGSKSAATSANYTSADETFDNFSKGDASVSYRERLDYWENGYITPTKKELEFYHNAPSLRPQLLNGKVLEDPDADDGGLRLPIDRSVLTSAREEERNWDPSYFPSTKLSRSPRYFQYRLLQAMAARHLCGGALGQDEKLENRLLRLLSSPAQHEREPLTKFAPARTLLRLSQQLGCNALIFAKHTWSNPMEAARQLGLLQNSTIFENHKLAGRLHHPNQLVQFLKMRRKRVLREYKLKSSSWIHGSTRDESNQMETVALSQAQKTSSPVDLGGAKTSKETVQGAPQVEGDKIAEDHRSDEEVESPIGKGGLTNNGKTQDSTIEKTNKDQARDPIQDDKGTDDGTSAGGVIIDLQTVQSEPTDGNLNFNENPAWQIAVNEAMLYPTSTFSHIPGTSSPEPQLPLDVTGIVYGPNDRYAKYDHQDTHTHHGHVQLAVATFLSRAVRGSDDQQRKARQMIQSMLEQYVTLTENKGFRRQLVQTRGKVRDVPLVQFFLAIRSYCSFWSNGYPLLTEEQVKEEGEETLIKDEADDDLYAENHTTGDSIDTRQVATHLFEFLEKHIHHNGLVRFPQLRVTYVLAAICRKLPIGAAKILSRALDDECPTPFHIMRQTCEYLESNSLIQGGRDVDYNDLEEDSMLAGELEYIFYEAAEMLEACVKANPTGIEYHAWRIGALAVCFLLGSGNRIGSEARQYPSSLTRKAYERVGKDDDILEHEVREKLPKYEDVTSQLSSAIRVLFALARHQPGSRSHLTITSLLEWPQVIALLAGDALGTSTETISLLYHHHALQRFLQENSAGARRLIAPSSRTSVFYASELENDPGNIDCWRSLSKALGPVGTKLSPDEDANTHRNECTHCQLLRPPRVVNHDRREGSSANWWGRGREWWSSSILQIKDEKIQKRNQSKTEAVIFVILESQNGVSESQNGVSHYIPDSENTALLNWLPNRQVLKHRRKMNPSRKERSTTFDKSLPPFTDEDSTAFAGNGHFLGSIQGKISPELEVLCYKILIFCHLEGPGHPFVESRVYPLIRDSWDNKKECVKEKSDQFQVLLWLCNVGLDIPRMSRLRYPKNLRQPLKKSFVK
jgi:hypothetical protein